mmetsp:Transcript_124631/g.248730  ORF Transcript_124631/g.248730 Transcript_124631/m.248730 type:complete len:282 (+) Transcript_124631:1175-2020(+)
MQNSVGSCSHVSHKNSLPSAQGYHCKHSWHTASRNRRTSASCQQRSAHGMNWPEEMATCDISARAANADELCTNKSHLRRSPQAIDKKSGALVPTVNARLTNLTHAASHSSCPWRGGHMILMHSLARTLALSSDDTCGKDSSTRIIDVGCRFKALSAKKTSSQNCTTCKQASASTAVASMSASSSWSISVFLNCATMFLARSASTTNTRERKLVPSIQISLMICASWISLCLARSFWQSGWIRQHSWSSRFKAKTVRSPLSMSKSTQQPDNCCTMTFITFL